MVPTSVFRNICCAHVAPDGRVEQIPRQGSISSEALASIIGKNEEVLGMRLFGFNPETIVQLRQILSISAIDAHPFRDGNPESPQ